MTPAARTMTELRKQGYLVDVTEKWNSFTKQRKDLFNFIDLLAVKVGFLAIQTTSYSNISARYKKITTECRDAAIRWLQAGGKIEIWGWHKVKNRWQFKVREVTENDLFN